MAQDNSGRLTAGSFDKGQEVPKEYTLETPTGNVLAQRDAGMGTVTLQQNDCEITLSEQDWQTLIVQMFPSVPQQSGLAHI